jgi:hypothetical protein
VTTHGSELANSSFSRFNPSVLTRRGFCSRSQPHPLGSWLLRHAVFAFYNLLPSSAFLRLTLADHGSVIFSAILGGLIGWWAFMPEYFFFTRGRELELLMYMLACGFLIWGADNYRRLAERLQKEEDLRKLVGGSCPHSGAAAWLSRDFPAMPLPYAAHRRSLPTLRCPFPPRPASYLANYQAPAEAR